tara:strand:- start:2080 stop:2871 length:792 start_codon:yes stop_codon:yes gene_type:complete
MKSRILIIFLFLFGLFYSCNEKPKNKRTEFIESKLFGKVKSIETRTFENDTLKLIDLKIYRKDGIIEKSKFSFEPNLSFGETLYKYNNKNKLEKKVIISDGDTTDTDLYFYNNLGLLKKEEYYENKLHCVTNFKIDSFGKIIEKNFKYVNSDGMRTFKFYYPDSLTAVIKEYLRGNPDLRTEIKIYPEENKKEILKTDIFPKSEFGEVFYHNNLGNLIKKEKFYEGKKTETKNFIYELDLNKNWVKSESGIIRKERKIEYYKN